MTVAEAQKVGADAFARRLRAARSELAEDHPFSGVRYDRKLALVRQLERGLSLLGYQLAEDRPQS
jgi:hypothetical protein